jgi:uncharacterized short protein YbdD (DUF466 family)
MKYLKKCWRFLAQVMGEGEYGRYCAHLRAHHPERPIPTASEFYLSRMEERYARPDRCC